MKLLRHLLKLSTCIYLASHIVHANPNNGSSYPQSAATLWPVYQSAIENDPLNITSQFVETISYGFLAGVNDVKMESIRYDLGTLAGTKSDGSAKTVQPKIAALYGYPSDASATKKYPAIVIIHGGGQIPGWFETYEWAARGYVVINVNWGGKNMSSISGTTLVDGFSQGTVGANYDNTDWDGLAAGFKRDVTSEPVNYNRTDPVVDAQHFSSEGIENQTFSDGFTLFEHADHPLNAAFLLNSYAARRAITLLSNDPKVDSSKIGVMGFSMGGITTTITGTDPRIKCLVPTVGGTAYDYNDYDRLPGATGKNYIYNGLDAQDNPTFDWYQCVVSQQSYWPTISVPAMFVNGTNDFNAPFDHVQPSLDLLPASVKGVSVNTPHANHRLQDRTFTSNVLWMRQYLKDDFQFPSEPTSSLDLADVAQVPIFSVTPDQTVTSSVKAVKVYYGYDRLSLERFWHKAVAVETTPGTWQAACPVFNSTEPLIAFAEVTYDIGFGQNIGFNKTSSEFTISSRVQFANNKVDGLVPNVVADNSRSRLIDDFTDELDDWFDYSNGVGWQFGTFKIGAPRYTGPNGAAMLFDIQTTAAGNTIAIDLKDGWHSSSNTYRAFVSVPASGLNSVNIAQSQFTHISTGVPLPSWENIEVMDFFIANAVNPSAYPLGWQGDKPILSNMRWGGGVYSSGNTNEAPYFDAVSYTRGAATVNTAYSATLTGTVTDPELGALSYKIVAGPAWLNMALTGALSGTPASADAGMNRWVIEVADPLGGKNYASLEIEVETATITSDILTEDFENTQGSGVPTGYVTVGTSGFRNGWPGTSFTSQGITLDVNTPNGTYSNLINNVVGPTTLGPYVGGQFYGTLGFGQIASFDTGESFLEGSEYEFSFLHYQAKNTPSGGRLITAQLYDPVTSMIYATESFPAVNNQNVAETRTLSYTATSSANGNNIGVRFLADSVDYSDADPAFDENFFYGAAVDNIRLQVSSTPPSVDNYSGWITNPVFGIAPADQGFDDDVDNDGLSNGVEAFFGTNPGNWNKGVLMLNSTGVIAQFSHPHNASMPSDINASYEWSLDLDSWYKADGTDGATTGITVIVNTVIVSNTTYVTALPSVSNQEKLFLRVKVTN